MIRFVRCSLGADAIEVMKKVNRYAKTGEEVENEFLIAIPDINDEMRELKGRIEARKQVYTYPEIKNENKWIYLIKRIIRKMSWWILEYVFQQQNEFNGLVLQYIDLMQEKQNIIEKIIDERYVERKEINDAGYKNS